MGWIRLPCSDSSRSRGHLAFLRAADMQRYDRRRSNDQEKWEPVFLGTNAEHLPGDHAQTKTEITIRFKPIGS
jgi:hypothetical protein